MTVVPGDTIDGIARRYGVPAAAIMQANRITAPASIRPGQRLIVPRTRSAAATPATPMPRVASTVPPSPAPAPPHAPAVGEKVHVVRAGETLSSIARHVRKSRTALAKANNIEPDAKLRVGQQIVIPDAKAGAARAGAAEPGAPRQAGNAGPAVAQAPAGKPQPTQAPPANQKVSTAGPVATARLTSPSSDSKGDAEGGATSPETTGSPPVFRWPVHGRIISGFGPKPNGQQNDGINVSVPEGTSIKAADDGVVAYAGNELKGYGNLILVRHPNGFVTAYANASELMVKRGDQVTRGQVIARSGQTGTVTSPQLHFEIRKGATPVDPTQYLSGT